MIKPYKPYRVTWSIDIDADSPEDAARHALEIQRDPQSIATFFEVVNTDSGVIYEVDLEKEKEMRSIPIADSKVSFVHTEIHTDATTLVHGRYIIPRDYHLTIGYRVDAMTTEEKRDPAFTVSCGLAFCDDNGPDEFRKSDGRKYAVKHMTEHPLVVNLYAGQTILDAVYIALSKRSSSELRALHVPQRLNAFFRSMRRRKQSKPIASAPATLCGALEQKSSARRMYNVYIAEGKTREEAIALLRGGRHGCS